MHAYSFLEHDLTHMKDLLQPVGYSREDAEKIAAKKTEVLRASPPSQGVEMEISIIF